MNRYKAKAVVQWVEIKLQVLFMPELIEDLAFVPLECGPAAVHSLVLPSSLPITFVHRFCDH